MYLHELRCQLWWQPLQALGYACQQASRVAHALRTHLLHALCKAAALILQR